MHNSGITRYICVLSILIFVSVANLFAPVMADEGYMAIPSWALQHQDEMMGKYSDQSVESMIGGQEMKSSSSSSTDNSVLNNTTPTPATPTSGIDKMIDAANEQLKSKAFSDASDSFNKIILIDSTSFAANYGKGQALEGLNKSSDALDSYRNAIQYNSRSSAPVWEAYAAEGRIMHDLGRNLQAIGALEQGISLFPAKSESSDKTELAKMLKIKGDAETALGKTTDAKASYQKAKEIDPSV